MKFNLNSQISSKLKNKYKKLPSFIIKIRSTYNYKFSKVKLSNKNELHSAKTTEQSLLNRYLI